MVSQIQNKALPILWVLANMLSSIVSDGIHMQRLKGPEWQKMKTYDAKTFPKR